MMTFIKSIGFLVSLLIVFSVQIDADRPKLSTSLSQIHTMDDLLKSWGVKSSSERKYIEDDTKQKLQDEISKIGDTKLDVVVYLQTLNHFANGESKKANTYLAQEVLKKILENLIGNGAMTALTASWDFTAYTWSSIQQWAEKKDMQTYKKFLLSHTKKWHSGVDLWETERRQVRHIFDLWWNETYWIRLGKTKMYKNRQIYYKKFKNDTYWHFRQVAKRYYDAYRADQRLKAISQRRQDNIRKIILQKRSLYRHARYNLILAKEKGDMTTLVKRYWSDRSYRNEIDKRARNNLAKYVEEKVGVKLDKNTTMISIRQSIKTIEAFKKRVKNGEIKADKRGNITPPLVEVDLSPYRTLIGDYRKITAAFFSPALAEMDQTSLRFAKESIVGLSLLRWQRSADMFRSQVGKVIAFYKGAWRYNPTLGVNSRIKDEIDRIESATVRFERELLQEKRKREKNAARSIRSLSGQIKTLKKLFSDNRLFDWRFLAKNEKVFAKKVKSFISHTELPPLYEKVTPAYARDILKKDIVLPRHYTPPLRFVNDITPNPLEAMHIYQKYTTKYIDIYGKYCDKIDKKIKNRVKKCEALQQKRKIAIDKYRQSAAALLPQWQYLFVSVNLSPKTGVTIPHISVDPESWQSLSMEKNRECQLFIDTQTNKLRYNEDRLKIYNDYEIEMQRDFQREENLLREVQSLLARIKKISKIYRNQKGTIGKNNENFIAIEWLRMDRDGYKRAKSVYRDMYECNRRAKKILDGASSRSKNSLSYSINCSLNHMPYSAQRRYPKRCITLLEQMKGIYKRAENSHIDSTKERESLKSSQRIVREIDTIRSSVTLLWKPVEDIKEKILQYAGKIATYNAQKTFRDIDGAKKNLTLFEEYATRCREEYNHDGKRMISYLQRAKAIIAAMESSKTTDPRQISQAHSLLKQAREYQEFMERYALYRGGEWRFQKEISKLEKHLKKLRQSSGFKSIHYNNYEIELNHTPLKILKHKWRDRNSIKIVSKESLLNISNSKIDKKLSKNILSTYMKICELPAPGATNRENIRYQNCLRDRKRYKKVSNGYIFAVRYKMKPYGTINIDIELAYQAKNGIAYHRPYPNGVFVQWWSDTYDEDNNDIGKNNSSSDIQEIKDEHSGYKSDDIRGNNNKTAERCLVSSDSAYRLYNNAYSKLNALMHRGQGDNKEAQEYYRLYKFYKDCYNIMTKTASSSQTSLHNGRNSATQISGNTQQPVSDSGSFASGSGNISGSDTSKIILKTPMSLSNHTSQIPFATHHPQQSTHLKREVKSIADVYVYAYHYRNWNRSNRGKYDQLVAGWHPTGGESRAYIKFDMSGIDASKVNRVMLRLYHFQTAGSNRVNLGIYRVTEPWEEGSDTYHSGHTEKTAAYGALSWIQQPPHDSRVIAIFNPGLKTGDWREVDITSLVKKWLTGAPNYGLLIKPLSHKQTSVYSFASRERDINLDHPKGKNKGPILRFITN